MPYGETKVYFDGSHYIAIPHTNETSFLFPAILMVLDDLQSQFPYHGQILRCITCPHPGIIRATASKLSDGLRCCDGE